MNISDSFLNSAILIIDEAHNITDSIEDNSGFELEENEIKMSISHI